MERKHKEALKFLNDVDIPLLEQLLDNCCRALTKQTEAHDFPQTTQLKILYPSLLWLFLNSVRNNLSTEAFKIALITDYGIIEEKAKLLENHYEVWFSRIRMHLLNNGSHLPHITDVKWKIDHIAKSNSLNQPNGPLFSIRLKTEKLDISSNQLKTEFLDFTCNSQELQDLVYKLKDAVRCCQKVATGS